MLDIMMTDLPRVEYGKGDKITAKDIREAEEKNAELAASIKSRHGIGAKLTNLVNTKNYLQSKAK